MADIDGIPGRLQTIRSRILKASVQVGRDAGGVTVIAVSKTFATDVIQPALEAGHRDFGENRVQEARDKWPGLKARYPKTTLHLIGPLQSNKVREALALFDVIHSLDRESLAAALSTEMARSSARPELFVQVNTGMEPQKSGVAPKDTPDFVLRAREIHGLRPRGLMCIPPEAEDPAPHFAMLRQIARDCGLPLLSMGMSGDFESAVKLGSTHVRIGSAIFGSRQTAPSI